MREFEQLLQENLVPLQRYVNFKINNKYDAEDVIQDVCLTATLKFDSLKEPSAFKAWLIGIASHKCNDYYRRKARDTSVSLESLPESALRMGRHGATVQSVVRDTLDLLGEKEKQILYFYFFMNLSQEEIAKQLAIPVGTVKSRLHYAKEKFKQHYPYSETKKGEPIMKKLPEFLPEYTITPIDDASVCSVVFEELPNWFIIPKVGEEIIWASYDMPKRNMTEKVHSKVTSAAFIHGIEGVEIMTDSERPDGKHTASAPHTYYAQLTETHCRWLGESYVDKNGAKRLLTFLDGDDFISEWGYGEDNCGSETHLAPRGIIRHDDGTVVVSANQHVMDVVGRYQVKFNGRVYDTVCIVEYYENGVLTEQYVDSDGKTILWRRFNRHDWAFAHYGKLWTELLPENERLTVNGETYIHWYDCITDYIF
ncbi:MAG: sigma-70 family RNA polymerase sigma factor [Clostridia bacterium]|nr:sigma-70 family RNA polymerase sigma factor [Clostridia bacterium]